MIPALQRGGSGLDRIAAIEARFGAPAAGRSSGPMSAAAFERLLAAQTADKPTDVTATTPTTNPISTLGPLDGAPAGTATGTAVVEAARKHLGVPYLWGGTDPDKGFDCSGLVQHAYRQAGIEMPKWSRHQATMGVEVASLDDALPGDVLAFGEPVNHVAIYLGDGRMLHAPRSGDVVRTTEIDRPIATIRRIVGPDPAGPTASPGIEPAGPAPVPTPSGFAAGEAEARYQSLFAAAGAQWNVDPALLAAIASAESNFDPTAVSHAGAQGLMQFMPATAASMGVDPWDPASAIDGAARYIRSSLDRFDGSVELAVASYNAGPGAVARYGGIPPYRETQNYVRKVMDGWTLRR